MVLFSPGDTPAAYHIMSITGPGGSGKTHLACQGPGKIGILSTDGKYDGLVQRFGGAAKFIIGAYFAQVDLTADELFKDRDTKEQAGAYADAQADRVRQEVMKPLTADYRSLLANKSVRTVVMDQADEINEYIRLANFGKLEKNPQLGNGLVNAEFKGLVRMAHEAKKSLVMINQMKQKYRNVVDDNGREKSVAMSDAGGNPVYVRRANESADYLIHSIVRCEAGVRDGMPEFKVHIVQAKLNPIMQGTVLVSPTWAELMGVLAPEVPAEEWE